MSSFQPRRGLQVWADAASPLILGQEIGKGGEGSVWSILENPSVVAKFYHNGLLADQVRKLEAMCRLKSESLLRIAAWPTAMLKPTAQAAPAGLLMRRISGYQEAHLLYSPKSRRTTFPDAQFPFILHSAANIARAFATVHEAGQVIGDVNHGNLMVSRDATVVLIDCDSFEITDGNKAFPCHVGVPTYTPPELQGRSSFEGVRRTKEHDAFGLAVLIFHLLFLGRHPFAGIFRHGSADKTIEDAIREYRFAYLPDNRTSEMEPPPYVPRLSEFPSELGNLFTRAFVKGAIAGRPTAREWIAPLEALAKHLKPCSASNAHQYFQLLSSCPWCRVEKVFGIPMFGLKIMVIPGQNFDLVAVWAQIESVRADEQPLSPPSTNAYMDQGKPDPTIPQVKQQRRKKRLMALGTVLLGVLIVAPGILPAFPSVLILALAVAGMAKFWRMAEVYATPFKANHKNATQAFATGMTRWRAIDRPPEIFAATQKKLQEEKQQFCDLPVLRSRRVMELKAGLSHKQLTRFLERYRIEDAHDSRHRPR